MNCKQGDLAIIVISAAGNEGKIVRCLELAGERAITPTGVSEDFPIWITDTMLPDCAGTAGIKVADFQLRPLRDKPGNEDWFIAAPTGKKVTA